MNRAGAGDTVTMSQAFSRPGADPREWVTCGTVEDEDPVRFDPELGPLVNVALQPSKISVACRVAMQCAGKGEGEWTPFVAGDEVAVVLPEGSSWTGAIIVGRLANGLDGFPMSSVAGQDPTKNNFAFKRNRTAYVHEMAGGYVVREAIGGAFLSLSKEGNVTLRDGSKGAVQLSADVFGYQSGDGKFVLQLALSDQRFTLQVDDAIISLAASGATPNKSAIVTPAPLAISANAQPAAEHVLTTEALCNILVNVLMALGAANPGPILGAALGGIAPAVIAASIPLALVSPQNPAVGAALVGAFSAALKKPAPIPVLGQTQPGIGCVGLLSG